jgi:2-polyprenyl-6-methoxyphenol hydroxylase-like FAD-dependent oxidoreductase
MIRKLHVTLKYLYKTTDPQDLHIPATKMSNLHAPLNILISGSGIAGPCLAFWLHKLLPTCTITILERSPVPRHGGQAVDLRSASVPIVTKMGLLDTVRDKTTTEEGVQFVYLDGKTKATFPASGNVEAQSGKTYCACINKRI